MVKVRYTMRFEKDLTQIVQGQNESVDAYTERIADEIYKYKEDHVDGEVLWVDDVEEM